jgi:hypothetical protein
MRNLRTLGVGDYVAALGFSPTWPGERPGRRGYFSARGYLYFLSRD